MIVDNKGGSEGPSSDDRAIKGPICKHRRKRSRALVVNANESPHFVFELVRENTVAKPVSSAIVKWELVPLLP